MKFIKKKYQDYLIKKAKREVAKAIFAEFESVATINIYSCEIKISAHDYDELKYKYAKDDDE